MGNCCLQVLRRRQKKLYEETEQNEQVYSKKKVVMIGLDGSGKTTILNYLKNQGFTEGLSPTIGLNVETISYKSHDYLIFDCGGKFENVDAIIFVIDTTDKQRMLKVREEFIKLNEELMYKSAPIIAFFNKQDLKSQLEEDQDLIDICGLNDVIDIDVIVQKCSAKTGEGIIEGFDKLSYYLNNTKKDIHYYTSQQNQELSQSNQNNNNNKQLQQSQQQSYSFVMHQQIHQMVYLQ